MKKIIMLTWIFVCLSIISEAVTKSIKDFGAKGDGVTNDHEAFQKAADFFKKNGGNGKLVIPAGTYRVGKQTRSKTGKRYIIESDVFYLTRCSNFTIEGIGKVKIKYVGKLRFGSFNPADDSKFSPAKFPFYDATRSAQIGCLFRFENCSGISILNIEADGNSTQMIIGGAYGDTGIQLWHYGVHLRDCYNVKLNKLNVHHFCLDGLVISNDPKQPGNCVISNSSFTYNGRQAFSWVGGNGVLASNCSFSHTGQANISSSPGAGLDIEPEGSRTISNGVFENCSFINNFGCGLLADASGSSDMVFKKCTFWGLDRWSVNVQQKSYSFYDCNLYGSFVKGCYTSRYDEATKFFSCVFKDSSYNGKKAYGKYLLECDGRKKMIFDNCTFVPKTKKIMWYNGVGSKKEEDQPVFKNCSVIINGRKEPYKK